MNENIVKDKIKFTMECSQDEMVFLDIKIVAKPIVDKGCYNSRQVFQKTDTPQYLSPNSCDPKNQTKNISIEVADRIRKNCSDNIINDITYKKRLIEYKAYLKVKKIQIRSFVRATMPRRETYK